MAEKQTFAVGDVVRLKSGGPTMTVDELCSDGVICVVWFADEHVMRDAFMPAQLISATEDGSGWINC